MKNKFIVLKKGPIVGLNIKTEFPQNPDIIINNNFKKSIQLLANELIAKLRKI